ncbi:MAG: AAA family ATPase [Acidobacteriota bacterium]
MAYARLAYDPWEIPPEERRATLVGREALLQQLLSAVREQEGHRTIQHYLLLGPRGIGKTTVLLTLRDRVREDPHLSKRWFCVQLREEEYFIRTLRDLLDLTLQALASDENLPEASDLAQRVHDEHDGERSRAIAVDGLRTISKMHDKRILLLIDNFDQVFPRTPTGRRKTRSAQNEYRAFRKLLSGESSIMVIGASVCLFEEIAAYDQAFFNFFCPVDIPNLTDDEICELLRKRAEADANPGFVQNFEEVKDKVRAITYITGGNPRLVLMLYDVLRQREMLPVVQALRETVGSLTPMLKHVLDDMPRQQSKTLDALVRLGGAASPSNISRLARLPLNVVTAQLGRLRDARFVSVEGQGKGKPATYRVSDPMFRTWYQMRYLRPAGRRIELFVEFLRVWFSVEDRRRFLEERWQQFQTCVDGGPHARLAEVSLGIEYFAASLEDQHERRAQFERLADGVFEAGRSQQAARLLAEFATPAAMSEASYEATGYRMLGDRLIDKGDLARAIETYSAALERDPQNVEARICLGLSLGRSGDHSRAKEELDKVISNPALRNGTLSSALLNRAVAEWALGDREGAIADYTAVVELPGAAPGQVATALVGRGLAKQALGNDHGAVFDYTAAVELPEASAKHVALALASRAHAKRVLRDTQGAIGDYTGVAELPGATLEQIAQALLARGVALAQLGRRTDAIRDFERCTELKTDADSVYRAFALQMKAYLTDGGLQEATECISRLHKIEPESAPLEERLEARVRAIISAGREHSLDSASTVLEAAMHHDPDAIREHLAFLQPAIELARTGSEQVIAALPDQERELAKQIAAVLVRKAGQDGTLDPNSEKQP